MTDRTDFESHGLQCHVILTDMGHYCGYVRVPPEHPWSGKSYNDTVPVPESVIKRPIDVDRIGVFNLFCASEPTVDACELTLAVDVHGGITYAGSEHGGWVFGFDCAHSGDARSPDTEDEYSTWRDFDFAKNETEDLARQLADVATWEVNVK